jgi:hypothetical protein
MRRQNDVRVGQWKAEKAVSLNVHRYNEALNRRNEQVDAKLACVAEIVRSQKHRQEGLLILSLACNRPRVLSSLISAALKPL